MEPLEYQFYSFFIMVLAGFLIGILFDFYRIIRNFVRPKKIATGVGDVLFWIIVTAVAFVLLIYGNWGQLRFYVFIGLALGVRIYFVLFSKMFIKIFKNTFLLIGKLISLIWRIICFLFGVVLIPFKIIRNIVIIPLGIISITFGRVGSYCGVFIRRFFLRPVRARFDKVKRRIVLKLIRMLKIKK